MNDAHAKRSAHDGSGRSTGEVPAVLDRELSRSDRLRCVTVGLATRGHRRGGLAVGDPAGAAAAHPPRLRRHRRARHRVGGGNRLRVDPAAEVVGR